MTKYVSLSQTLLRSTAFKATLEVVLLAAEGPALWWWTHGMATSLALVLQDHKRFLVNKIYQVSRKFIDKTILVFFLKEQQKAHYFNAGGEDHYPMNHVGISSSLGRTVEEE